MTSHNIFLFFQILSYDGLIRLLHYNAHISYQSELSHLCASVQKEGEVEAYLRVVLLYNFALVYNCTLVTIRQFGTRSRFSNKNMYNIICARPRWDELLIGYLDLHKGLAVMLNMSTPRHMLAMPVIDLHHSHCQTRVDVRWFRLNLAADTLAKTCNEHSSMKLFQILLCSL